MTGDEGRDDIWQTLSAGLEPGSLQLRCQHSTESLCLQQHHSVKLAVLWKGLDTKLEHVVFYFCSCALFWLSFCFFCRFPQGCSLCCHRERRSNSKSVGVPLIWTLADWTSTPITQALLWIPTPPLLPSHLPFHPTSLPPPSSPNIKPHPQIFISSGCTYHHGYLPIALSGPITFVLLCKLFLDVDRAIKCYTKKYSCMVIQNCIL